MKKLLLIAGLVVAVGTTIFVALTLQQKLHISGLVAARRGFTSRLVPSKFDREPVDIPPPGSFDLVKYQGAAGAMPAYVTSDPKDGQRHPAIVWIHGGDSNSIGDVWSPQRGRNDQSASAFRKAGIVSLFPSLRGGNLNPGQREGFLGEVDDVLAATAYLESLPYVDPQRIYLGGHSTGGTLAILVAECSNRYRAVFAFGPVGDVRGYGTDSEYLPFDTSKEREIWLRSPQYWLQEVSCPLWVVEGTMPPCNNDELLTMEEKSQNPNCHFVSVPNASHFSVLGPGNQVFAALIQADTGPECNISVDAQAIQAAVMTAR